MIGLLSIFQISIQPQLIIMILIPIIIIILELTFLKMGLMITKAEERTSLKWVVGSFFIQAGVIAFIALPFILMQFSGVLYILSTPSLFIPVLIFGAFIEINLINAIHEPGFGKSILILIFLVIPIFLTGFFIIPGLINVIRVAI